MDEALIVGFVCLLPLAMLIGLAALITWLVRSSNNKTRLTQLEASVSHLHHANNSLVFRLAELERRAQRGGEGLGLPRKTDTSTEIAAESQPAPASNAVPASDAAPVPASAPAPVPASAPASDAVPATPTAPPRATHTAPASVSLASNDAPGTPPPFPPVPSAPAPPSPASPGSFESSWEKWIGVRGAAALGAGVLVLAGLFFFKYSIEQGLITPTMRVVLTTLVGLGCLVASEWPLRRNYPVLANWLAGAGSALLYLSIWSAASLYALVPVQVAFPLMALVTSACCLLAVRHRAVSIAVLGLLGGFATPLLLSTGSDRPIALFGYILLLDGALLFVAHRRKWPALGLLSLAGTALYQGLWIVTRMGDRLWLGMGILVVFAAVFAIVELNRAGSSEPKERNLTALCTRMFGVLTPFLFALYFALRSDLGAHLWPIAGLLTLLCAGASWVGHREKLPLLGAGAAAASLAVLGGWLMTHPLDGPLAWEVVTCVGLLAAIFHAWLETADERGGDALSGLGATITAYGGLWLTVLAACFAEGVAPWPWLVGWAVLGALTVRQGRLGTRELWTPTVALTLGVALAALHLARGGDASFPTEVVFAALASLGAMAFQLLAVLRRTHTGRRMSDHAAATIAAVLLLHYLVLPTPYPQSPMLFFSATTLLTLLILLAAARRGAGVWAFVAALSTAVVHAVWTFSEPGLDGTAGLIGLLFQGALVIVLVLWPFVAGPRLREDVWAWRTAALAGPLWFLQLRHLHLELLGDQLIGALPIVLGAVTLLAAHRVKTSGPRESAARRSALIWLTTAAMGFATVAIPLQLDNEWLTIAWALEGVAVLGLWRRFDHVGLKYFGLALLATVTVRLVLNQYVLDYHPRHGMPGLNWLIYTYLVPVASLIGAWWLLRGKEHARLRTWEAAVLPKRLDVAAHTCVVAAIAVGFVWINLTIFDIFAVGDQLTIPLSRLPARDLATSIAWAVYGLTMLAMGMWRRSTGLRAVSLGLLLLTCGKVFLYDLGHLTDLYRVGSLIGLAVSLMLVSLAYQRFVFRRATPSEGT